MGHEVFISYPSLDKTVADAVCHALEDHGIRCWVAHRDVIPGQEWAAAIVEAIAACRILVLVITEATKHSTHLAREVELAAAHAVVIVPFHVHDVRLTGSLQYFLESRHWLDAMTPPLEAHLQRLSDVVNRLLESTSRSPDPTGSSEPIRVLVHFARFVATTTLCCFINVTNWCRDEDVEITHVWLEGAHKKHFAHNPDRPLPKRLRPRESWETWIPVPSLEGEFHDVDWYSSGRVRVSTGEVVVSSRNDSVPPEGSVPGGPIAKFP